MDKITELKARVYDLLAQQQYIQNEINKVNNEIAELNNKEKKPEEPIAEEPIV